MQISKSIFCLVLFLTVSALSEATPDRPIEESPAAPLLREASDIALKQGEEQHFWTDRVLLQIADAQIRAGDFEGALKSLRGSHYTWGREIGLRDLTKAFVGDGRKDRALEVVALIEPSDAKRQIRNRRWIDSLWVERLIASGELESASQAIERIEADYVSNALRQLAGAYAKAGDEIRSKVVFERAIKAAERLTSESERANVLSAIACSQHEVGATDDAKATMRRLVDQPIKNAWTKFTVMLQLAELSVKMKDRVTASEFFRGALAAQANVDDSNKFNALHLVAISQAHSGFVNDAIANAAKIEHSEKEWGRISYRERALVAVAEAQFDLGDPKAAVATAMSVEHFLQYRDDALRSIADGHVAKREWSPAIAAAEQFHNPSRRAAAILAVATGAAKAGDRKAAIQFAEQIRLTHQAGGVGRIGVDEDNGFDFRVPNSWVAGYDFHPFAFTMASHRMSVRREAELAFAAMSLAQAVDLKHGESFDESFKDVTWEEVIEAVARAHAATGNPAQAAKWARAIGNGEEIKSKDVGASWPVTRRMHALIGVAEGMLDRSTGGSQRK